MPSLSPKSNTDWPELLKDVIFGKQQKKKKKKKEKWTKESGKPSH